MKHPSPTDLPVASKAGDAIGDSSTLKNSVPSAGRLGRGAATSHDTHARTLAATVLYHLSRFTCNAPGASELDLDVAQRLP